MAVQGCRAAGQKVQLHEETAGAGSSPSWGKWEDGASDLELAGAGALFGEAEGAFPGRSCRCAALSEALEQQRAFMLCLPVALGHAEGLGSSLCQDSKLCLPKDSLRQGKLSFLKSSRFGCGPATCISADPIQVYAGGSSTELCLNDLGSNPPECTFS